MLIHKHGARHNTTRFIQLDTRLCKACWECIGSCEQQVIGKTDFLFHRHAVIKYADKCKGCKKCVQACKMNAIRFIYTAGH